MLNNKILEEELTNEEINKMEEEQHFYHTIQDFQDLIKIYGIKKVLRALDEDVYWAFQRELGIL